VQAAGDFTPGTRPGLLGSGLALGGGPPTPFGVSICYEITYPGLVAAQVRSGATFLTTLTNDAWFGRSAAPAQHFAMAVLRAAESRRWLLRAANTGISGVVGPDGGVRQATALFVTALVEGSVEPRRELTFAVRHPQAVPVACVIMLLLAALAAATSRWNKISAPSTMT
jgi:apolipoprotein N-acyltransferase